MELSALDMLVSLGFGYLSGTIPFGLLLTRVAGLGDVRQIGSGNIGATNVLRTGNKSIAALTLLLDALKGTVPVLVMSHLLSEQAGILAGLAAFFGHLFPMWLGFKGGKGVATNLGVLFGLAWPLGLAFVAIWLLVAFTVKMSSAAALTASFMMPLLAWMLGYSTLIFPTLILTVVIWMTHRANIARLLRGEEPRISLSKKA